MHRKELGNIIQHRTRRIFHVGVRHPATVHAHEVQLARLQRTRRNRHLRVEVVVTERAVVILLVSELQRVREHGLTHHLACCRVNLIQGENRLFTIPHEVLTLREDMPTLNPQRRILPRVINRRPAETVGRAGRLRILNHINMGADVNTIYRTQQIQLIYIRGVVRHEHVKELAVRRLNVLRGNLKRVGEATVRVLPHLMLQILEKPAVLVERRIIITPIMHVHRSTSHQSQLVEGVLLTELGAQRGSRHRHRAALRNIESSRIDLQLHVSGVHRANRISGRRRHRKLRAHRELMATVQILRIRERYLNFCRRAHVRGVEPVIILNLIFDFHRTGAVRIAGYDFVALIVLARYIILRKRCTLTRGSVINRHRVNVVPQVNLG